MVTRHVEGTVVQKDTVAARVEVTTGAPIVKELHRDVIHEHHKNVVHEHHKNVMHEHHQQVIHEHHQPIIYKEQVHEIHQPVIHERHQEIIHELHKPIIHEQHKEVVEEERQAAQLLTAEARPIVKTEIVNAPIVQQEAAQPAQVLLEEVAAPTQVVKTTTVTQETTGAIPLNEEVYVVDPKTGKRTMRQKLHDIFHPHHHNP